MTANFWDDRYSRTGYVYGTEPNEFVASQAHLIPPGPVLCLAEGEGRNAVFLAGRGHDVTAVDASAVGLSKAGRLAASRGLALKAVVSDLADYRIEPGAWSGVVAIWAHLPPELRRRVHAEAAKGLAPGGVFLLEAYTPEQIRRATGGPKEPELCMTLGALRAELGALEYVVARECVRDVFEGTGHTGTACVVQVCARRPAS